MEKCDHMMTMIVVTYQEAHEVQGEYSGDPSERQPLKHCAADPGWVTVVFGTTVGRAVVLTSTCLTKTKYRHGNYQHSEHAHCCILAENLREETKLLHLIIINNLQIMTRSNRIKLKALNRTDTFTSLLIFWNIIFDRLYPGSVWPLPTPVYPGPLQSTPTSQISSLPRFIPVCLTAQDNFSGFYIPSTGVPQGSVLGPISSIYCCLNK